MLTAATAAPTADDCAALLLLMLSLPLSLLVLALVSNEPDARFELPAPPPSMPASRDVNDRDAGSFVGCVRRVRDVRFDTTTTELRVS